MGVPFQKVFPDLWSFFCQSLLGVPNGSQQTAAHILQVWLLSCRVNHISQHQNRSSSSIPRAISGLDIFDKKWAAQYVASDLILVQTYNLPKCHIQRANRSFISFLLNVCWSARWFVTHQNGSADNRDNQNYFRENITVNAFNAHTKYIFSTSFFVLV